MSNKQLTNSEPEGSVLSSVPSYAAELGTRIGVVAKQQTNQKLFAEQIGVKEPTLYRYINGINVPSVEIATKIASIGGVNIEWLATGRGPMRDSDQSQSVFEEEFALVPIYNVSVSAGSGIFPPESEQAIGRLAFTRHWLRKYRLEAEHLTAINAEGDSMEPTINDGTMIVVDMSQNEVRRDDIYVILHEDVLRVKRIQRESGANVRIISDNAFYPSYKASLKEVKIIGRVVWYGKTLS